MPPATDKGSHKARVQGPLSTRTKPIICGSQLTIGFLGSSQLRHGALGVHTMRKARISRYTRRRGRCRRPQTDWRKPVCLTRQPSLVNP
jgi:hypothetical protein